MSDSQSSYPTTIINLMEDIQTGGDKMWWDIVNDFPDDMKGSIAKKLWQDPNFSYGLEYGALIIIYHLLQELQSSPTTVREQNES